MLRQPVERIVIDGAIAVGLNLAVAEMSRINHRPAPWRVILRVKLTSERTGLNRQH
jgi:hypothetical protein